MPVDARPVVCGQVVQLVATAKQAGAIDGLLTPSVALLGHFRQPANREALAEWLWEVAESAEGFVVSLDMLIYGGLVPSRFIDDDLVSLLARLDVLRRLKVRFPHKPVYAFLATMRISNNNVNAEEKLYWAGHGEQIWRWSYHADKYAVSGDVESKQLASRAEQQIPALIRQDYLATRKRNFAVAKAVVGMVGDEGINGLILPQDDTAEFGFNIAERRQLQELVDVRRLQDRVRIYAGADEVAHTLCAHLVNEICVNPPLKVCCVFSDPIGVHTLVARYEDRTLLAALQSQLDVVDAVMVDSIDAADVVVGVHTQGSSQGDWAMGVVLPVVAGIDGRWLEQLQLARRAGKPVAVADVAYANGGDPVMVEKLAALFPLTGLAAYAGWNTASNSIGSLVAQCSLARNAFEDQANQAVLCLRLVEDYLYQAIWRQNIRDAIDESTLGPAQLEAAVADMFIPAANHWLAEHRFMFRVLSIRLPWQRTFEIDIQLIPVADRQET